MISEYNRACYSYGAINDCLIAVKNFSYTTRVKRDHIKMVEPLKALYDLCLKKTVDWNFKTEYSYAYNRYYEMVKYEYELNTKHKMDCTLVFALKELMRELYDLIRMMDYGEVDATE